MLCLTLLDGKNGGSIKEADLWKYMDGKMPCWCLLSRAKRPLVLCRRVPTYSWCLRQLAEDADTVFRFKWSPHDEQGRIQKMGRLIEWGSGYLQRFIISLPMKCHVSSSQKCPDNPGLHFKGVHGTRLTQTLDWQLGYNEQPKAGYLHVDIFRFVASEHVAGTVWNGHVDTAWFRNRVIGVELRVFAPVGVRVHSTAVQLHTHTHTHTHVHTIRYWYYFWTLGKHVSDRF